MFGVECGVFDVEGVGYGVNIVWIYSIVGWVLCVNVDNVDVDLMVYYLYERVCLGE